MAIEQAARGLPQFRWKRWLRTAAPPGFELLPDIVEIGLSFRAHCDLQAWMNPSPSAYALTARPLPHSCRQVTINLTQPIRKVTNASKRRVAIPAMRNAG